MMLLQGLTPLLNAQLDIFQEFARHLALKVDRIEFSQILATKGNLNDLNNSSKSVNCHTSSTLTVAASEVAEGDKENGRADTTINTIQRFDFSSEHQRAKIRPNQRNFEEIQELII
jgi:hypothetical protein